MANDTDYDFVVIGGGTAGFSAATRAVKLGMRTALVEDAPLLGGLCILNGCMPTKTLIEPGNRSREARYARWFGVQLPDGEPVVEMRAVRKRKQRLVAEFRNFREKQLNSGGFDLIRGRARFLGPQDIEVTMSDGGCEHLYARTTLIATGSYPLLPDLPGLAEVPYWFSHDVLELDDLPSSVLIIGGGAVGMEVGHFFEGSGCKVTILHRGAHPLSNLDADLGGVLDKVSRDRGMTMEMRVTTTSVERCGDGGVRVHWTRYGQSFSSEAEKLLIATGRAPSLESLNLPAAGLAMDGGRLAADATTATAIPHIFVAGDASSPRPVVHLAAIQGETAATNAARLLGMLDSPEPASYRPELIFTCIFTQPEIGQAGMTEEEVRLSGFDPIVASYPYAEHGKAQVHGAREGFVRLVADRASGRLLGGAVVGLRGVGLIHLIVVALAARMTAAEYAAVPHYHPTLEEIWTYPAMEIAESLAHPG
jgi:pyruvate/2-oxoglutarate dehydrogenase complex dihydrolipoamide dehydrogenase (E3) component